MNQRIFLLLLCCALHFWGQACPTIITASPSAIICLGGSVTLTASGSSTYQWLSGGPSAASWTVSPTVNTTYTVIGSSPGCNDTATITITVNPIPIVTAATQNDTVCQGVSTSLSATGAATYSWQPGQLTGSPVSATPLVNTVFTVTGTSAAGCTSTASVSVATKAAPKPVLIDSAAQALFTSPFNNCGNTTGNPTYSVTVYPQPAPNVVSYSLNWGNGQPTLTGLTAASFPLTNVYNTFGVFNLVFTAYFTNGCQRDTLIPVINETNPAIGCTGPGNTQGCGPIQYWFKITGYQNNTPGTSYLWDFGDGTTVLWNSVTVDSIAHTYTTTSCGLPGNQYVVKVTAKNACDSTTATVNGIRIYQKPIPQFSVIPNIACINTAVSIQNSSVLAANSNCTNTTNWLWNFGDPGSGPANTSTLQNPGSHVYANPGTYTITLIASAFCGSDTLQQTVCIEDNLASFQAVAQGLCAPAQINLNNTSPLLNNCSPPNFLWSISKTSSTCSADSLNDVLFLGGGGPNSSSPSVQLNNQGTYFITLSKTNSCGTQTKDTTFTVKRHPEIIPIAGTSICFPDSVFPIATVTNCGTAPLTYLWSAPGGNPLNSTSPTPGFLFPTGQHTLSLNVSNECGPTSLSQTVTVNPQPILSLNVIPNNGICAGSSATLTAGGASQFQWTWAGGSSVSSTLTVSPGATTTYTLTGTDANGCTASTFYTLLVHPNPQLTSSITPPTCQPGGDGSLQLTAIGGSTPYTFILNGNAQPGGFFSNLATGTYTASVSDAFGCSASAIQVISAPNAPTFNTLTGTQPTCNGYNNGSLTAAATGGTGILQYQLQPGNLSNAIGSFSGLSSGTYTITVTDAAGCTAISTLNLGQPVVLTMSLPGITMPSCFGLSNGQITAALAGGTSPYAYTLNPGNINNVNGIFSGLAQGSYTISGADANGCSASITVTITQPQALTWTSVNAVNIACFNQNTGSLTVQAGGGTTAYAYLVNPGSLSNGTGLFAGLTAQTYTIQVSDANGCTLTTAQTLTQPSALSFNNIAQTLPTCIPGADGSLQVNGLGGTSGYLFAISPAFNYTASNTFSNLSPGTYTILVMDANQCTASTVFSLNAPNAPILQSVQAVSPSCQPGLDGSVQVNAQAGTPPLQYNLVPGFATYQPSNTFNGLAPGIYTATVLDASGCSVSTIMTLAVPVAPVITGSSLTPASCSPGCDGSIITTANGNSPLQYQLNAGPWQSGNTFNMLCGGQYTITVKDAANCSVSSTAQILIGGALQFTVDSLKTITCNGAADGLIDLLATGGTGTITYTLNPGNQNNTTGLYGNLAPGTYTVTAVDGTGCSAVTSFNMTEPPTLSWNFINTIPVSCYGGSNGSVSASTIGGTAPFTFTFNPGGSVNTSGIFNNLAAGNYTIIATDVNGCFISATTQITQSALLQIVSLSNTVPTCVPGNDANLTVIASGGTNPLTYSAGGPLQLSNTITGLGAGTFTVTVSDANGCTASSIWSIVQPNAPSFSNASGTPVTCPGGSDGGISSLATGGTGSLTYTLQPGNQSNATGNFISLSAATYTLTVTDALGCASSTLVTILQPSPWSLPLLQSDSVKCAGDSNGSLTIMAAGGTPPYSYTLQPGGMTNSTGLFTGLQAGTYIVMVTDAAGCSHTTSIQIDQPLPLSISNTNVQPVICFGSTTGTLNVNALGGTGTLTYTLQPGGTSNTTGNFTPLAAGAYTITVSDQQNCSISTNLSIGTPAALLIDSLQIAAPSCLPSSAAVFVSGGTTPYNFSLNGAPTQPNAQWNNLAAGTYTLVVTDAQGCSTSQIFSIVPPASPLINSLSVTPPSCYGLTNGSIGNVNISGGALPYTTTILPGGSFTNLGAGTYTVQVTDANSCTASSVVVLNQPPAITLNSLNLVNPSCHNTNDGSVTVSASGGSGTLFYNLLPLGTGNTSGLFTTLAPNSYTLTITDDSNCVYTLNAGLTSPPSIQWTSVAFTPITCNGLNNGSIVGQAIGGTGPLQYSLSPALLPSNNTGAFSPLPANNYTLTVQDQNNCQLDSAMALLQPPPVTGSFFIQNQVSCFNGQNGAFTVLANSGTLPFQYYLLGSALVNNSGNFSGLGAGTYTVQIVDGSNCFTQIGPITLIQPAPISWASVSVPLIRCNGAATDSLSVSASGGSGGITYSIAPLGPQSNPSGQFTGLIAQAYTVTATDGNACTLTTTLSINQLPAIMIDAAQADPPRCFGEPTGGILVAASGGTPPLSYSLNGGGFGPQPAFAGLPAGIYTLSLRDANNCQRDTVFTLADPPLLQFSNYTVGSVICADSSDAIISVQATGGVGSLVYGLLPDSVTNLSGQFSQLASGNYTITVRDSLGCSLDSTAFVTPAQNPLQMTISSQDLACLGVGTEGWAQANVSGGAQPYNYLWSTNPVQESKRATGLRFGYYDVLVTDFKGCTIRDTVYIVPGPCCEEIYLPNAFTPNGDRLNDVFRAVTAAGIQLIHFDIYNRWGERVFSTDDYTKGWDGKINQTEDAPLGTYYYQFIYRCLTDDKTYTRKGDVIVVR